MKAWRILLAVATLMLPLTAMGQKGGKAAADFDAETLTVELLEWMNKQTSDSDKQKENTRTVKALEASYAAMDDATQRRVTGVFNYVVRTKMKANPEVCSVARVLTAYATAPAGAANLDGWLQTVEAMGKRSAKAKAVMEFVDFSDMLLGERVLYRSNSCEWRLDPQAPFSLALDGGKVVVRFDTPTDLQYASARDGGVIRGTTGSYDYKENEWSGHGGRIDWSRTGLGAEACYAELSAYKAVVKFPKFTADSVLFVNTHYFSQPIAGRIEEALTVPMEPEKYSYPRFRSYQRDFVIPNILPDVDYSGSFMMNGAKFITASSKHQATLIFRRGGKPQLAVTSNKFTITTDRMVSENAAVALYIGDGDSISNAGITVRYQTADRRVTLINDPKRNFYSPYIDTYHEMDIYSDVITWKLDAADVQFTTLSTGTTGNTVTFESSSYYSYRKYREIQGIDEISPVRRVYDYVGDGNYTFSINKFSDYIGLDIGQTKLMIHNLARHGLVTYNEITERVTVKEKLEDYVKAFAKKKGFDYDALMLESQVSADDRSGNAVLSLDDSRLAMRGVEQIVVSDSQQVVLYPRGGRVSVGRNRALTFDGRLDAGKFIFFVTGAQFDYEKYNFELPQVDSMFFYVPKFDDADSDHLVMTPLYGLVGNLAVDKPDNHSGLKRNKRYPIFNSLESSYVYYDKPEIRGGRYDRMRFNYELHPFTLSGIRKFEIDSLQFNGVLHSGGIFPDITYPLTVQRDYYLGFRVQTPAGGYPAYGERGTYRHAISLDHGGLQGNGELDYLTSHSTSKNYLFLLDSMLCTADTFTVREEQGFPEIRAGRVSQHWMPYEDSMAVATLAKGRPFSMYRDEATLRGRVDIMPQGAAAAGTAQVNDATLASERFRLQPRIMDAAVSTFTLHSKAFNEVAFTAKDISSHVDYDGRRAELRMPDGPRRTELQLVQMEAYADFFVWDMNRQHLAIVNSTRSTTEGLDAMDLRMRLRKYPDLPGARFVSTDPKQHGLAYHALNSTYLYNRADLTNRGVYLLAVADAAIAPATDTVHIDKGGQMRALRDAQVVFDRDSAYHLITDANLVVQGAESFTGSGYIVYHNDTERGQRLFLDNISVSSEGYTTASGTISDSASFELSSAFGFAGKVRADGNSRWLYFDGGVRMLQSCIGRNQLGLLAYADYTDPEHIHIPVPELATDWHGRRIATGILMDKSTLQPLTAFLTDDKVADNELLGTHGVLTYLGDRRQYMIASEEKVSNPDGVTAPYLALSTADCNVEGEGLVNFAMRRTQASFYAYGTASLSTGTSTDQDHLATLFGIDFPIDKGVVEALAEAFKDDLRLSTPSSALSTPMMHALMYHLGADRGAAVYADYADEGRLETVPEAMRSTMLFDRVRWQYNPAIGLYYDGRATLVAVGNEPLGLELRLRAQITKRGVAQQMVFYVEAAKDHWYWFKYDLYTGDLTVYSSSGLWLDRIKALSADQRKREQKGLVDFRYAVGNNPKEVSNWLSMLSRTLYSDDEDF